MKKKIDIIGVIPAHLKSIRFPQKILCLIDGLPMIEHVRRRALLSKNLKKVVVATCDVEIFDVIKNFGGEVIMTSSTHTNGTSRVAEAIQKIDCSHVMLLQGDEPLILPSSIDQVFNAIKTNPHGLMWNATGPIHNEKEMQKHSFVKCAVNNKNKILYLFRNNPSYATFDIQKKYIKKILGLIAFEKDFLMKFVEWPSSIIEENEFIEQMRAIENGFQINSVNLEESVPSVNEPHELDIVLNYLKQNKEQKNLLNKIKFNYI